MAATLILTRDPQVFVIQAGIQVRYSTMVVLKGDKLDTVKIVAEQGAGSDAIKVPTGVLDLTFVSSGGAVKEAARYTVMERWASCIAAPKPKAGKTTPVFDSIKGCPADKPMFGQTYLCIMPLPRAYPIWLQQKNGKVVKLRDDGLCYRLRNTTRLNEDAVMIHEAPNANWLEGCISPRKLGDQKSETDTSKTAFDDLAKIVKHDGDLFVLNW